MSLRELRRLWGQRKQSCVPCDPGGGQEQSQEPKPSLPLLQVWPSQDSPQGDADGQYFLFPQPDDPSSSSSAHHDSGIDSVQASPCGVTTSPGLTVTSPSALLHPNHARLLRRPSSPEQSTSVDEPDVGPASASSSTASSLTSVAAAAAAVSAVSRDNWERDRRRSSTMTARYSLLDALDLEYALLRAAARGSVGPYSLSESIHKLTFTQSLAFPGLARGLAGKRRRSFYARSAPAESGETGLNAFAKIVTALVLMLVSVMVFGVVYKFVKT
ncbi:uncharacterized protein LOC106670649 [Cimex lectularius]|uniref:Uncharacterized protein n=1 Tax=Cimex lectularius TaxID=79782 RepID=A0A8I6S4F7_CIMLE|nr:uncharacterized protein LOC106670649 [Cimex lectularius]